MTHSKIWQKQTSNERQLLRTLYARRQSQSFSSLTTDFLHKLTRPDLSRKSFQNIVYRLEEHVRSFLAQMELLRAESNRDLFLLLALRKRGLFKQCNKLASKTLKSCEEKSSIGLWHSLHNMVIHHYQYISENPIKYQEGSEIIENAMQNLDKFYRQMKLFYQVEAINRNITLSEPIQDSIAVNSDESKTSTSFNLTNLFTHLISLQEGDNESYTWIRENLISDGINLSKDLQHITLMHLIQYVMRKIKKGEMQMGPELLKLYDFGLNQELFLLNNRIPVRRFHNMVDIACGLGEVAWAEQCLEKWSPSVGKEVQKQVVTLGEAQIHFAKEEFDDVVSKLSSTRFKEFDQEVRAKWLLLCSHYELDWKHQFYLKAQIKSFERFIKKNKGQMSRITHSSLFNLVAFIKRLLSKEDIAKVQADFEQEHNLIFRSWLSKKIREKAQRLQKR